MGVKTKVGLTSSSPDVRKKSDVSGIGEVQARKVIEWYDLLCCESCNNEKTQTCPLYLVT